MKIDTVLKKYKRSLVIEGLVKAFLTGLIIGFCVNLVYAFIDWLFGLKTVYLGVIIGACVMLLSAILLYFLKYRPTDKQIAQRLDALGLLERIITMNELKNDTSYIALRQRSEAMAALNGISAGMLKTAVSSVLVVMVAVSLVFSAGFTVAAQTAEKSGTQIIDEIINGEQEKYCTINYETDGDGYIDGDMFQEVEKGKDGSPVTAIAEEGWMFVGWTDGYTEPTRQEFKVDQDVDVCAIFMEAEESEESGDDDSEGNGEGDGGNGQSGHPGEGEGNGQGDGTGEGDGAPGDGQEGQGESMEGQGEGAGSGKSLASNQIIDGDSYYGDYYGSAVSDAASGGNNGEGSDIVNNYIKGLGGN